MARQSRRWGVSAGALVGAATVLSPSLLMECVCAFTAPKLSYKAIVSTTRSALHPRLGDNTNRRQRKFSGTATTSTLLVALEPRTEDRSKVTDDASSSPLPVLKLPLPFHADDRLQGSQVEGSLPGRTSIPWPTPPALQKPPAALLSTPPSASYLDSRQLRDDKYRTLGLLWAIACLSALDRVAMSVALVPMADDLGFLTDTVKGSISSFFSVGYGVAIVPVGLLVSQVSPKVVLAVGLALWSCATLATPSAALQWESFPAGLLAARALVGAGESAIVPSLQRLLVAWTSPAEKATALAAVYSGFHAGTIAAYVVSPWLLHALPDGQGWQGLFAVYGAAGLGLLLPWCMWAQDGPPPPGSIEKTRTTNTARTGGGGTLTSPPPPTDIMLQAHQGWEAMQRTLRDAPWNDLVHSQAAWALLLAHCAKNWGLYNALAWTPTFYAEQYNLGVQESSWLSVLPSITGAICVVSAGTAADALFRWLNSRRPNRDDTTDTQALVRKTFQLVAFLGQGAVLAALAWHIPEQASTAQAYLMAAFGLMAFNAAGFESGIQEKAGDKWAGLLYSVTSLPAVLIGTAGVYATGRILDATHQDWSCVYGLNAAVNVLGAIAFVTFYNSKREFD